MVNADLYLIIGVLAMGGGVIIALLKEDRDMFEILWTIAAGFTGANMLARSHDGSAASIIAPFFFGVCALMTILCVLMPINYPGVNTSAQSEDK